MRANCSAFIGSIMIVSRLASNAEASDLGKCASGEHQVVKTPSGEVVFVPMREKFVEDDGKEGPNEDFAKNIEHFLFSPQSLKKQTPKVYDWIRKRYGDKFIPVKGSAK